jgi:hypothetical protein
LRMRACWDLCRHILCIPPLLTTWKVVASTPHIKYITTKKKKKQSQMKGKETMESSTLKRNGRALCVRGTQRTGDERACFTLFEQRCPSSYNIHESIFFFWRWSHLPTSKQKQQTTSLSLSLSVCVHSSKARGS